MITEQGFTRKTYQDILEGKIQKAKELFGEDIDTSDYTPLGKFIRINAYDQAEAEEQAEAIYYSIFPQTATGTGLDRLCQFVGITRSSATPSRYTVSLTGTAGEVVPVGFLVGTESGVQFYNTLDTEIAEDGSCSISVECTEAGIIGNVNTEDLNIIVNPDANVSGITGAICEMLGTDTENDVSLRNRFTAAREGLGSCNESSIRAALMRIETVTSASVVANSTNETDENGRPPHSFECYVSGGENYHKEIAETIFAKKPLGIKTYGSVSETVTDEAGNQHIISFSHTGNILIKVAVKIKTSALFEGDTGIQGIAENIATYINGLGVGNSVVLSALYGKVHSVEGVTEVTELTMSVDGGEYQSNNVDISTYEVAQCTDVSVEVVS